MRILLVQHQPHGRRLFRHLLSDFGHEVVDCSDARELAGALGTGDFQLVLLDRTLPEVQFTRLVGDVRVHSSSREAIIVAIVAEKHEHEIPALISAGIDDYLHLPVELNTLQLRLKVLLKHASRNAAPVPAGSATLGGADAIRIFDALPLPSLAIDDDGTLIAVNERFAALCGYEPPELIGEAGEFVGLPSAREIELIRAATGPEPGKAQTFQLVRRDMKPAPVAISWSKLDTSPRSLLVGQIHPRVDGGGGPHAVGEDPGAEAVASVTFDHNGWIWTISPALAGLLDVLTGAVIGQNVRSIIHEADLAMIPRLIARSKTGNLGQQPAHLRMLRSDGEWLTVRATGRESAPVNGGKPQFTIEVSEAGADARPAPSGNATPVQLEGRDEFLMVAEELVLNRDLEREPVALLHITLDDFRALTQAHGYETGDVVLEEVARRLVGALGPDDIFARLGDGEFAALVAAPSDHARAAGVATRMINALRSRSIQTQRGQAISATASIGIALSASDTKTVATLLRRADMAAAVASSRGRGNYEIFEPEIEVRNTSRLQIEQDLVQAVARNEFRVFYQPEIHLETGAIVGAEALVRWEHPSNGLIMPGQFIELAESAELIVPIGVHVLEKAARQAAAWRKEFQLDEGFVIGVNFSMKQFQRPRIVDEVRAILRRAGLPPSALRIEVTESNAIDHDTRILGTLERLQRTGIRLAIDDFGTGYASLTQLRALPIDTVKIDRTFISGSGTGSGQLSIARSVMSMARSSGMDVVVEGIETLAQLKVILDSDCTRGQGFYFSRPITAETFEFWLKSGPHPFQGAIGAARNESRCRAGAGSSSHR